MKIIKNMGYVVFLLLLTNCMGQHQQQAAHEQKVKVFNQQEHRLEFKDSLLFYNGTQVKLDQSLAYYEGVFGTDHQWGDSYGDIIVYKNIPISLNKGMDDIVDNIRIYLYYLNQKMVNDKTLGNDYKYYKSILDEDYVLVDGYPINKNFNDLEALNNLLERNNKLGFKTGIKGGGGVHRQYLTQTMNYSYRMSINATTGMGKLSPVSWIDYSNAGTRSD